MFWSMLGQGHGERCGTFQITCLFHFTGKQVHKMNPDWVRRGHPLHYRYDHCHLVLETSFGARVSTVLTRQWSRSIKFRPIQLPDPITSWAQLSIIKFQPIDEKTWTNIRVIKSTWNDGNHRWQKFIYGNFEFLVLSMYCTWYNWIIVHPTTRGRSRSFGFTHGELSSWCSLYTVSG